MSDVKDFEAAKVRARELRSYGMSYDAIAKTLMREHFLTGTGRTCWNVSAAYLVAREKRPCCKTCGQELKGKKR